ncbi:leucine-rich repeat-containing protein 57 [Nilaparvata lugens]|uniref:leucine-rich repeat-containing protein 57 n=1 Tax=Nilaparvata lugens TaxID=108931 RepID=UPI000B97F3F2|nr:leucine-rich repeat-containing protein 57 [Nilaparvata lugens]
MGNSALKSHFEHGQKTGVLNLSKQKLDEFPSGMKSLSNNLRSLDMSDNKFTVIPTEIHTYQKLKVLILNRNRLTNLPDELGSLAKLESFSATDNKLTTLPTSFANLTALKKVHLSGNLIKEFPVMLCGLSHLDFIDLSKNKLTTVPKGVAKLQCIELNLNQNQISSIHLDLASCPRLKTLRIEENCLPLEGFPSEIFYLSNVSLICAEGNLFEMKSFMDLDGYEKYMERYTAVKNKLL